MTSLTEPLVHRRRELTISILLLKFLVYHPVDIDGLDFSNSFSCLSSEITSGIQYQSLGLSKLIIKNIDVYDRVVFGLRFGLTLNDLVLNST